MARELFTATVPSEPDWYWLRQPGLKDICGFVDGNGVAWTKTGPMKCDTAVTRGVLFGPRIPSPESLAGDAGKETKGETE